MSEMKFQFEYRDKITSLTVTINVQEEPQGWDELKIKLVRDMEFFGVNYHFTDAETELAFDTISGGDIIKKVFDYYGNDGELTFRYFVDNNLEYEGKVDLNTYKNDDGIIKCNIVKQSVHDLINSRSEISVDILAAQTIDGSENIPSWQLVGLYPIEISKKAIYEADDQYYESPEIEAQNIDYNFQQHYAVTLQLTQKEENFEATTINDNSIDIFPEPSDGSAPTVLIPVAEFGENANCQLLLRTTLSCTVLVGSNPPPNDIKRGNFSIVARLNDSVGAVKQTVTMLSESVPYTIAEGVEINGVTYDYAQVFSFNSSLNLKELTATINGITSGDKLYIYGFFVGTNWGSLTWSKAYATSHDYKANGDNFQIVAKTSQPYSQTKSINLDNALKSVYKIISGTENISLEMDRKTKYAITNGYSIRNNPTDTQFSTTFKQMMVNIKNLWSYGYRYKTNSGNEVLTVEPIANLFKPNQIIEITDVSNYAEEVAKEFIYNEIETGFEKYSEEGAVGGDDDTQTKSTHTTTIKTIKNKLACISSWISSSYTIEQVRRLIWSTDENVTSNNDDSLFIIALNEAETEAESYNFVYNTRTGQNTYNLRISPKRILLNWLSFLSGCLKYKPDTDLIRNTAFVRNGKSGSTIDGITAYENESLVIENPKKAAFYEPLWITFSTTLTYNQIKVIRDAHDGNDSITDMGYISVVAYNGEVKNGWLFEMTYNPYTFLADFKLLKANLVNLLTGDNAILTGDNDTLTGDQTIQ